MQRDQRAYTMTFWAVFIGFVTGIEVSGGENMVRLSVSADLSILFPSVVPKVIVTQDGIAKLRALTH